ncbi:MAG: tetratricopeptide repeat protein [Deltaproteobacteria bacterium]|nr:tetratricopeptide repeat protein [Deltaproteobacteria bacterium]
MTRDSRHRGLFNQSRLGALSEFLMLALLVVTPLLVGTVHPLTILLTSLTAQAALALDFIRRRRHGRSDIVFGALGLVFTLTLAWTILQAVPLPRGLLELISPKSVEIRDFVLKDTAKWTIASLSMDQPATIIESIRFLGLLSIFLLALNRVASRHERISRMLGVLVATGAAITILGLFQKLFGVTAILGIYDTPAVKNNYFTATFVNPNHLAGYLALLAPVGVGLTLDTRDKHKKVLCALGSGLIMLGAVLSMSRGGIIAILLGQILLFLLLLAKKIRDKRALVSIALVTLAALSVASWLAYKELAEQYETMDTAQKITTDEKIQAWKSVWPMVKDFWLTGIGRGAFATVYSIYKTIPDRLTYTHAENEAIQAVADLGTIAGGLLILAIALAFLFLSTSRGLTPTKCGVIAGLMACSFQNMVDFNLETGAVGLTFFALLGAVLGRSIRRNSGKKRWHKSFVRIPASKGLAVLSSLSLMSAGFGSWASLHSMSMDTFDVMTAIDSEGYEKALLTGRQVLGHRPADFYLAYLLARAALEEGKTRQAMHWVNRAQYLNPVAWEPHELAAFILMHIKRNKQARIEIRLAAEKAGTAFKPILKRAFRIFPYTKCWLEMTPDQPDQQEYLAMRLLQAHEAKQAFGILSSLIKEGHLEPRVLLLAARAAKEQGLVQKAMTLARNASRVDPTRPSPYMFMASLAGTGESCEQILREGLQNVDKKKRVYLQKRLALLLLNSGRLEEAIEIAEDMNKQAGIRYGVKATANWLLGMIEEKRGNVHQAVFYLQQAVKLDPASRSYRYRLALLLQRNGALKKAEAELKKLVGANPLNRAYEASLKRVQDKLKKSMSNLEEQDLKKQFP